ncbi:MAG: hypothetical protein JW727_01710 [Candidatus Aenigmarchaeota archaeon]|nr:hypothetical protein [Candidatus Aenigmarchaeota archaeon]
MKLKTLSPKKHASAKKQAAKLKIPSSDACLKAAPDSGRPFMMAVNKYNYELTCLVSSIFLAESKSDKRTLLLAKKIVKNWSEYFNALGVVIKKECGSSLPSTKLTLDYLKVQVSFLQVVDQELDHMLK